MWCCVFGCRGLLGLKSSDLLGFPTVFSSFLVHISKGPNGSYDSLSVKGSELAVEATG